MTGVFIQIRLDSFRLPEKALLPLGDMTVSEHAFRSLKNIPADVYALLTDRASAHRLTPLAEKWGFETFIGSRDDVLSRFSRATAHFSVDTLIRATGDNPLVSWEAAVRALQIFNDTESDYCGIRNLAYGAGVEILNSRALFRADREAVDPYEREHVTPYLYQNPELFKITLEEALAEERSEARITLDTREDYLFLIHIFRELYSGAVISYPDLIGWLDENNR